MTYDDITNADEFARIRESSDPEEQTRATFAAASITVWRSVIETYPHLKSWVVHNKTVPLEILKQLSRDTDARVRRATARKRKLDRALFERLAADDDESVRRAVAMNAKCPEDILCVLTAEFRDV